MIENSVFITGFSKFSGRSYPNNILELIHEIKVNNSNYLPNLMDISEEMTEFLENSDYNLEFNESIPYHKQIVLVDLFRIIKMKELLNSGYPIVGWVDADLLITSKLIIDDLTRFCQVYTRRVNGYQVDQSNGLMFTSDKKLLESWITKFKSPIEGEVDFSHYSRGIINQLKLNHKIESLGDVLSFTSYHDTDQWDKDFNLLRSNMNNPVGFNLSLSWKLDSINEVLDKLMRSLNE